ncbi:hypothetical protein LUX05_20760 [Streptomyces somaliensis]|uniref:hypothetical protein n=1 Tax=Streptomyces somaliensis TaxID=78355 RepID=UPI0034E95BD4|nr:hypothetical protein [Streptomyces somaliensis]MCP9976012.1 hypothetical protein [Streptomyces somaliensis]
MLLRGAQGQALVDDRAQGELVHHPREHAEDEHAAALAAGVDGLADGGRPVGLEAQLLLDLVVQVHRATAVGLHPDRLDAHVRPAAAGPLTQFRGHVDGGVVQRLAADVTLRHGQPLREAVDADHPFGA